MRESRLGTRLARGEHAIALSSLPHTRVASAQGAVRRLTFWEHHAA